MFSSLHKTNYKVKQPCIIHEICNVFINRFARDIKWPFKRSLNSNGPIIIFRGLIIQFKNYSCKRRGFETAND